MVLRIKKSTLKVLLFTATGSITVLLLLNRFATSTPALSPHTSSLGAIFLTGLIAGGLTCLAVQGGLLAATLAQREEEKLKKKTKVTGNTLPILAFLSTKLVAYTLLGFLLGLLGSAIQLSNTAQTILQFAVGIFMIGTALNILDVHPVFRYFIIQPPRFLTRLIRKQSKSKDIFAPALLGAFTVFIPCGTTQAIMALAIASGNPLTGAATLFVFVLGTSPLFFLFGYFATKLGDTLQLKFMKVAAYAIILLAVFNINNAVALTGSPYTLESTWKGILGVVAGATNPLQSSSDGNVATNNAEPVTNATISIADNGYTPSALTVKAGSKITFRLNNISGRGCTQAFTIPSLGIQKIIPLGSSDTVVFTAPNQPTQIAFMCGMGMYRGVISVI